MYLTLSYVFRGITIFDKYMDNFFLKTTVILWMIFQLWWMVDNENEKSYYAHAFYHNLEGGFGEGLWVTASAEFAGEATLVVVVLAAWAAAAAAAIAVGDIPIRPWRLVGTWKPARPLRGWKAMWNGECGWWGELKEEKQYKYLIERILGLVLAVLFLRK